MHDVDLASYDESVRLLYECGEERYIVCAACHQTALKRFAGVAPALRGSPWLDLHPHGRIRIVLNGLGKLCFYRKFTWFL
jgi:mono/diheme cytochrome c family protein